MKKIDFEISKKTENIITWGLVVICALCYISLVFNRNVWLDEAFTASLVRTDMAGVLERSMEDTLPPLYNILLKISTDIFGYTVPVMKMTSVMPMIIILILSATVVRRRHGFKTSALFTIAMTAMPNLLFFGVEIRMYSLGLLFATAAGIYGYEVICDYSKKNLVIFALVTALAGYSHHFAFVTIGFVYLFMLLYYFFLERKNIKRWFFCLIGTIVLYFPCLLVTLKQFKSVSGYFSMPDVTLSVFIKYMRYPYTVGNTVATIMLLILVATVLLYTVLKLVSFAKKVRESHSLDEGILRESNPEELRDMYAISMFLVYYGVLVFGTVISKFMTANIFVDRYLLFAHGMLWLFVAIEAGRFEKYYYVIIVVFIFVGICGYINEYKIEYSENPDKLIAFLDSYVDSGDILYAVEDSEEMAFCLPFYDEELTNYENLKEAIKAKEDTNENMWISVIDYAEYDFSELEGYGFEANYVDTFTFDRYTVDIYEVISK